MLPLLTGELAAAQSEMVAAFCDQTCSIYRDTGKATPGTYGSSSSSRGNTAAYTQLATGVSIGLEPPSQAELQNFDYLIADKIAWRACFPLAQDVQPQDHIVIGTQVLEVHVLLTPESYPMLLHAIVAELKP